MSQFTQKAIIQTFQDMLEKMPFDKITVSAIVANCEISSNTFYYHFRDIYDLLATWLSGIKRRYTENDDASWQEILKSLLKDMQKNPKLVYHLFNSLSRERIERYIFESMTDTFYQFLSNEIIDEKIPEKTLKSFSEYTCYSFLGFFLKFIWNHMNADVEESVNKISSFFEVSLNGLKNK